MKRSARIAALVATTLSVIAAPHASAQPSTQIEPLVAFRPGLYAHRSHTRAQKRSAMRTPLAVIFDRRFVTDDGSALVFVSPDKLTSFSFDRGIEQDAPPHGNVDLRDFSLVIGTAGTGSATRYVACYTRADYEADPDRVTKRKTIRIRKDLKLMGLKSGYAADFNACPRLRSR